MGVHVPEAPGYHGWTRLSDGSWKTLNVAEIAECAAAVKADREACPTCVAGGAGPLHGGTYTHGDNPNGRASAHSYHCRSHSRWFNPETRQMEGRAHCTCDSCY